MCSRTPQLCTRCCTVRGLGGGRCCCLCVMLESVRLLFIYQLGGGGGSADVTLSWGGCVSGHCAGACVYVLCMSAPPPSMQAPPVPSWAPDTEKERRRSGSVMWVYLYSVLSCWYVDRMEKEVQVQHMPCDLRQYCCCRRVKTLYLQEKKEKRQQLHGCFYCS